MQIVSALLTESLAIWPVSYVSSFYCSHSQTQYFVLGKIDKEQLTSCANRQGISPDEARK